MENKPDGYYSIARTDIAEIVPRTCKTVLEIGAGFGSLGELLIRRQGCVVDGVELNPMAATHLEKKYRRFWIGDIEKMDWDGANENYDCLLLPDVLEHLSDPWSALNRLTAWLKPGSFVVASIPNIRNLAILYDLAVRGKWSYQNSGILDRTHLRFFTRESITQMFSNNGLEIEEWFLKRDRYRRPKNYLAAAVRLLVPDIDVCQYIVRAKKL